ncbi:MAG: asparaginase domain-containing protein [Chloroflexota bacterium]
MEIKIFTTGGTIDKIYFDRKSAYEVGEPTIDEVLAEANVTVAYRCETIMRKDSLDLSDADRQKIYDMVQADEHRHIVITHGTDTMIQTAQKLQPLAAEKVIVLTGSMMPAKFKSSDAMFNIGGALIAVQALPPGVYIVMNGQIFDPRQTRKNVELNRFEQV